MWRSDQMKKSHPTSALHVRSAFVLLHCHSGFAFERCPECMVIEPSLQADGASLRGVNRRATANKCSRARSIGKTPCSMGGLLESSSSPEPRHDV